MIILKRSRPVDDNVEVSEHERGRGSLRHALAVALCVLLLIVGVWLCVAAATPRWPDVVDVPLLVALLAPAYYAAHLYSVDLEVRRETHSLTLVHLPLALGVLLLAPLAHLAARVLSSCALVVRQRQEPLKALYNVAAAAFEVGAAAYAVGLVPENETGPPLWIALYVGLLLGDVVGSLVLSTVWALLGLPMSLRAALRVVAVEAPVTLVFTATSIVAVSAVRVEPATAVVVLGLVAGLALAYRAHRRLVGQQKAVQALYAFVKDLGPLRFDSPEAGRTIERMRVLLHAARLDLAVLQDDRWCRLVAAEGELPSWRAADPEGAAAAGTTWTSPALLPQSGSDGDTMVTPLLAGGDFAGLLTATGRLGAARGFDMGDLRLLETVGAELATALDRGRLLADLERSATTDALTGLPNLTETARRVTELLQQDGGVVLAAVAVDSFREVNDTLGHEVGDELLLEVARRLSACCHDGVLGRIGGGRFAVALPAALAGDEPELYGLGLRAQVEGAAQIGPVGTHVRLSVGVVSGPEHGTDAATLVRRAETAMYSARSAGGGPVLWEPAYEVQGTRRLAVVMALREALASGAIGVAYQPKVETTTLRVTGVEALARWTHPALGPIRPDEFVPLAEASGLMGPLTASVLRQGLTACKGWQRRAPGVGVSVNVSAETVLDAAFVTEVAGLLAAAGVSAELLTLELTESVLLEDPALAAERMRELRSLGVKLSVDDFGTGYSSLTYLKGLPVDEVKIDKGFVDGVTSEPADRAVVRAVVDIGHTLGLRVVAEGVEQEDQQAILRSLGVDEVQGYLHARPMPALDVAAWLRRREVQIVL